MRRHVGDGVEANTAPVLRRSRWQALKDSVKCFMTKAARRLFNSQSRKSAPDTSHSIKPSTSANRETEQFGKSAPDTSHSIKPSTSANRETEQFGKSAPDTSHSIKPSTSANRETEQFQKSHHSEHGNPPIRRSQTPPVSTGYVLPIKPARESTTGPRPIQRVDSQGSEPEPFVRTLHIHLGEETEICRCLLDTGSDFNLVSEATLRGMGLTLSRRQGPALRGIGYVQILPIGSVFLTWHMDRKKPVTYCEEFWVISDDTPALFDVLIGKHWIKRHNALLSNPEVMIIRRFGSPSSPTPTRSVPEASVEELSQPTSQD